MAISDEDKKTFRSWFFGLLIFAIVASILVGIWLHGDPHFKNSTVVLKAAFTFGSLLLVFLFGVVVLAALASGLIDISELIEEESGGTSTSRFQLLIFTFVIGLSFVIVVTCKCEIPSLPANVLALLGVSATTYGVSKGIQFGGKNGNPTEDK